MCRLPRVRILSENNHGIEFVNHQSSGPNKTTSQKERIQAAYARRRGIDLYSFFNPGHVFMIQSQDRAALRLLQRFGYHRKMSSCSILEIGCGTGRWIQNFVEWGAHPENIVGVDLLLDRVEAARKRCHPDVRIIHGSAESLNFSDGTFDLVLQATVFTSILDQNLKKAMAKEMLRVLKPNGEILWYDFHMNNPWNPDVRGIPKREICALFKGCHIYLERTTLALPLTRFLARYSWLACYMLEKMKLFNTHYWCVIQKTL